VIAALAVDVALCQQVAAAGLPHLQIKTISKRVVKFDCSKLAVDVALCQHVSTAGLPHVHTCSQQWTVQVLVDRFC
jgi:hypothetical protein